jgi:hypothetical protein
MKKIIIAFTIFCIGNLTFAQEFYAGVKSGLKIEYYKRPLEKNAKSSNYFFQDGNVLVSSMDFSSPTVQAVFRTTFPSNWEVEAGFGWYNYSQKLKAKIDASCASFTFGFKNSSESKYIFSTSNERIYGCAFFSPKAGYRFNLSPNLHLRLNTGMQIGFLYNVRTSANTIVESDPFEMYIVYRGIKKPNINLLVSNTISLQYITKPRIYFSFFISYHAGLLNVYQSDVYIANRKSSESDFYNGHDTYINSSVTTRGSYFEFGIELGYMWSKNKE